MKKLTSVTGVAVWVISMGAAALGAQPSDAVSKANLSDMGLGGMQALSDAQGSAIRGLGMFSSSGHPSKPELRCFVDFKKSDHVRGDDKMVHHGRMDKIGHKDLGGPKDFGGHKDLGGDKGMRNGSFPSFSKVSLHFGGMMKVR